MSGSAANLPVSVTLQGADTTEAALRRIADRVQETFVANSQLAQQTPVALGRVSEAFGTLEQKTQGARGAVNDLRGAMELLGAGGAAGFLGPVGAGIGNLADALGTAQLAATQFSGVMGSLSALTGPLAVAMAAVGAAAYALNLSYEATAKAAEKAREAEQAYKEALERSEAVLQLNTRGSQDAAEARRQEAIASTQLAIALERENVARANEAASRSAAVRSRLEEAVASGRASPEQVAAGLARLGGTQTGLASIGGQASDRLADLEVRLRGLQNPGSVLRSSERPAWADLRPDVRPDALMEGTTTGRDLGLGAFGPSAPGATREGGGGGRAPADTAERDFQRAEDVARRAAESAIRQNERAQQQIADQNRRQVEQFERQSLDAFARIGESALDRIGTSLVDSFIRGESAALDFGRLARATLASIASDLLKLGAINPFTNAVFGTSRPTLAGAFGGGGGGDSGAEGFGGLLGLGGLSSIGSTLGLTGDGGMLTGLGSTLGLTGDGGLFSGLGSVSLGGAFAGIGGGFALGSLTSQLTARSSAQRTNGMIGSGLGAAAGFLLGGPVGGLLGGAAGGALGGLFGPGKGFSGGDAIISVGADGMLQLDRTVGKRFDAGALSANANQQIAAINAQLRASGLAFAAGSGVAALGGGQSANPTNLLESLGRGGILNTFTATNADAQRALDRVGQGSLQALIDAINQDRAQRAQEEAQREAQRAQEEAQRNQARGVAGGVIGSLADYARGLRTVGDNSSNPMDRLSAAQSQFEQDAAAAIAGNPQALSRLQSSAEGFRGLTRQVYGTGGGFASAERRIAAVLDQVGGLGQDALTASFYAEQQKTQTDTLVDAIGRLQSEVAKLRAEAQQRSASPFAVAA